MFRAVEALGHHVRDHCRRQNPDEDNLLGRNLVADVVVVDDNVLMGGRVFGEQYGAHVVAPDERRVGLAVAEFEGAEPSNPRSASGESHVFRPDRHG